MRKIKLLYDASCVCNILLKNSSRSGIFFVAYNVLLEFLRRDDFDVWLYADNIGKLDYLIANYPEFSHCKRYELTPFDNGVAYLGALRVKNKFESKKGLLKELTSFTSSIFQNLQKFYLNNFVNSSSVDDIDVYFSPMKAVPRFIEKNKSIKKYTILHDAIPLGHDYRENANHRWYFKLLDSINSDDKYFANSEYTKQDIIKHVPKINPDNIFVIPLSTGKPYSKITDIEVINKVKNKYNIPIGKKYIFSLCNLDPRKNLIFSIKNFLNFVENNKLDDFIFVLGGGHFDDFDKAINRSVEHLGEKKNLILRIGYVDDEDMSALYSGAEVFLFPSLYEGFGMPVLEAMKCGLPVITSNVTSLPEVIGDCGIQINPDSDEEMLNALDKMYFDRGFRQSCIDKGLERAKQFTWEKCLDVIENEIKEDINANTGYDKKKV